MTCAQRFYLVSMLFSILSSKYMIRTVQINLCESHCYQYTNIHLIILDFSQFQECKCQMLAIQCYVMEKQ